MFPEILNKCNYIYIYEHLKIREKSFPFLSLGDGERRGGLTTPINA
jgi:hypothetical protein